MASTIIPWGMCKMKCFQYTDSDAISLTSTAGQFNVLLKHYLVPLGWTVLEEDSNVLYIQNSFQSVLKSDSQQDFVRWQGFRQFSDRTNDRSGFPTIFQSSDLVVCKITTDLKWTLYANEFTFYFILNSELYGFGAFIPTVAEDLKPCFLLGKSTTASTQKLFTNLGEFESSNLSVAATTQSQTPWSTPLSFSYDQRIDYIKNTANKILPLSLISLHETRTNIVRGILPNISILSSKISETTDLSSTVYTYANSVFSLISVGNKTFAFEIS